MKFNELSIIKRLKIAARAANVASNDVFNPHFGPNSTGQAEIDKVHLKTLEKFGIKYDATLVNDHSRLYIKTAASDSNTRQSGNPFRHDNNASITFRVEGPDTLLDIVSNSVDVEVGELSVDRFGLTSAIKIGDDVAESLENIIAMLGCIGELVNIDSSIVETLLKIYDGLKKAAEIPEDTIALLGEYSSQRGVIRVIGDTLRHSNFDYDEEGNVINLPHMYIEDSGALGLRVVYGNQHSKSGRYSIRIKYDEKLGAKEGSIIVDSVFNYNSTINLLTVPVSTSIDVDGFVAALQNAVTAALEKDNQREDTKGLYEYFNTMLSEGLPFIKEKLATAGINDRTRPWF